MLLSDIYEKVSWILALNFNIQDKVNIYNANLSNELKLDYRDINLLLYYVENKFNISLNPDDEQKISNLNDLTQIIYNTKAKSKSA